MYSQEYLDRCTMLGEAMLALLDWSDEAQEDLLLVGLNGLAPPTYDAFRRLWLAMGATVGSDQWASRPTDDP